MPMVLRHLVCIQSKSVMAAAHHPQVALGLTGQKRSWLRGAARSACRVWGLGSTRLTSALFTQDLKTLSPKPPTLTRKFLCNTRWLPHTAKLPLLLKRQAPNPEPQTLMAGSGSALVWHWNEGGAAALRDSPRGSRTPEKRGRGCTGG